MAQSGAANAPLKWSDKSSPRASWSWSRRHAKWAQQKPSGARQRGARRPPPPPPPPPFLHSISLSPDPWRNNSDQPPAWARTNKAEMSKTDDDVGALVVLDQVDSSRFTWPQFTDGLERAQVDEAAPARVQQPAGSAQADTKLEGPPISVARATNRDIPRAQLKATRPIDNDDVATDGTREESACRINHHGQEVRGGWRPGATKSSSAIMPPGACSFAGGDPNGSMTRLIGQSRAGPPPSTGTARPPADDRTTCMSESVRRALEPAQATEIITTRHEQSCTESPADPIRWQRLVLISLCLLLWRSPTRNHPGTLLASAAGGQPANDRHLDFWRSLLVRLYGDRHRQATDELAAKLADWPDRHDAALFYVEQLARKLDAEGAAAAARGEAGRLERSGVCSSISLAALLAPRPVHASHPAPPPDPVDRDDLGTGRVWPRSLASHLEASAGRLARLAVDNANLITRLLLMQSQRPEPAATSANDAIGENNSTSASDNNSNDDADQGQGPALKQIESLLHQLVEPPLLDFMLDYKLREFHLSAAESPEMEQLRERLHSIGLVLFADEPLRARPKQGSRLQVAYSKVAMISADSRTSLIDLLRDDSDKGDARRRAAMLSPVLKWLRQADESADGEHLRRLAERLAPTISANEGRGNDDDTASGHATDETSANRTNKQQRAHLSESDGTWFAPHIQCDLSTRWLLTYSLPFFSIRAAEARPPAQEGASGSSKRLQIRGVSYVNLDLASMGSLISPCATSTEAAASVHEGDTQQQTPSFLADTSKCNLIGSSQCVPLPEYFEIGPNGAPNARPQFRPGAYVCQCPTRWPRLSQSDRRAAQAERRRLIRLLNSQGNSNDLLRLLVSNSAGPDNDDKLASELHFGPADRQAIAGLLAKRNSAELRLHEETSRPMRVTKSLVLGAELEFEAALNMLTGGGGGGGGATISDLSQGFHVKPSIRTCRACRNATETQASPTEDDNDLLNCQSGETSPMGRAALSSGLFIRYVRPLVLICQLVCIGATLALVGVILRIRKSRTILVSGWVMLETMLVGALLLHVSVLVRYFQPTSLTCLLGPWLRELGFSVFYGSILIKLYRMLTEFQTRKAHRVCMRDKDQIIYLLAIVFIVIGYMSAWTALMVDSFFVRQSPIAQRPMPMEPLVTSRGVNIPSWTRAQGEADAGEQQQLQLQLTGQPIERRHTSGLAAYAMNGQNQFPATESPLTSLDYRLKLAKTGGDNNRQQRGTSETLLETGNQFVNSPPPGQHQQRLESPEWPRGVAELTPDLGDSGRARRHVSAAAASRGHENGNLLDGQLEILARGLDSFGQLFLGLLETEQRFDLERDSFVYLVRCRKLTWDYVTESGEIALLLFGLHLVYKLRNASIEVNKEKLILGFGVLVELITSSLVYLIRHSLWHQLTSDHLLALNALRCQLSVTLTVVLVFGPKLRDIGRNKPGLLVSAICGRWALELLLENCACDLRMARSAAGSSTLSGPSSGAAAAASNPGGVPNWGPKQRGASVRHRCHISCEEHDHHLNDATRLHQAMLSNSALEIGSINLADMDPDEIQAELKRVYTQLELLKTKVMRRDNPHISKRRGGRKPGHRKFSLQAFHGRHSSTPAVTPAEPPNSAQPVQQQSSASVPRTNCDTTTASQVNPTVNLNDEGELPPRSKQQQQLNSIKRLPAVTELEGENSPARPCSNGGNQEERLPTYMHTIKHVRLDEPPLSQETTSAKYTQSTRQSNAAKSGKLSFSILAKRSSANSSSGGSGSGTGSNNHRKAAAAADHSTAKWTPELPSTSSLGYDEDALMNDSQSSGEMTPQHRSSIIYNHQS